MIIHKKGYSIRSEWFLSKNKKCSALFYQPNSVIKNMPVVIMAHGFGAEMSYGLHPFAHKFAQEGMAVFMFDYRGFGKSEGFIRKLVHPFHHLQDWEAALNHVKRISKIDPHRIGLWGSSFSGGHVLALAAANPNIKVVSAQVPYLCGISTSFQRSFTDILKITGSAFKDILRMATFRSPYYIAVAGTPEETAIMNKSDSLKGMRSIIPKGAKWENKCPARIALLTLFYNPIKQLSKIKCPCILINAENDSLFSKETVAKAAKKIKNCVLVNLDCGHFDPYTGIYFEKAIYEEVRFLKLHLI